MPMSTPEDAFARPGLKISVQRVRATHVNRWHSSMVAATASPHPDEYGTLDSALPDDLNAAFGAYLMARVTPLLRRNLLHALVNGEPKEWPRLVGGPPGVTPQPPVTPSWRPRD